MDKNPDYYGEMAQTNDDNQEEKIIEVDPNEGKEVAEVPATEAPATEVPAEVPTVEAPVKVPEPTVIPDQVLEQSSKDL